METYQVLEKALGLIEREEDWCGHGLGTKNWGSDPGGTTCMGGAIGRVLGAIRWDEATDNPAARSLTDFLPAGDSIARFNDSHTHAEVCDLFRTAIRAEKAKAGVPLDVPEPVRDDGTWTEEFTEMERRLGV